MLRLHWNKADTILYQRCFNVVSTSSTDTVSTLYNIENLPSDFASSSMLDQCYFNVDPQR